MTLTLKLALAFVLVGQILALNTHSGLYSGTPETQNKLNNDLGENEDFHIFTIKDLFNQRKLY